MSTTATNATSLDIAAYLRVSSYAIFFFDYLQTLPMEVRLYARQKGITKLSTACILFILVRYVGLVTLVVGNQGFFYHGFSEEACHRYFWVTPVFKFVLYLISQTILAIRTYAVSRKAPWVKYVLIILFAVVLVVEAVSTFYRRVPFQDNGNCTSGSPPGIPMASLYYAGGLAFDVVTMAITFAYLFKFSTANGASMNKLARIMFEDGITYFLALTAMNIVNIIFFQSPDTSLQSSAGGLGIAATTIYSGHFILNLREHGQTPNSHSSRHRENRILRGGVGADPISNTGIYVTRNVEITMDVENDGSGNLKKGAWNEADIA